MNICQKCVHWFACMGTRYCNVQTKEMIKVNRLPNNDGNLVIYVEECTKFIKFKPFKGQIK